MGPSNYSTLRKFMHPQENKYSNRMEFKTQDKFIWSKFWVNGVTWSSDNVSFLKASRSKDKLDMYQSYLKCIQDNRHVSRIHLTCIQITANTKGKLWLKEGLRFHWTEIMQPTGKWLHQWELQISSTRFKYFQTYKIIFTQYSEVLISFDYFCNQYGQRFI